MWIDAERELPLVPYEWDVPRRSTGCLGATLGAVAVLLATLFTAWAEGPDTAELRCSRAAARCTWATPLRFYELPLLNGTRVENGPTREDGSTSPNWRVVLETPGEVIATTEVPDKHDADLFAAEVTSFLAGDAPELEAIWAIPADPTGPVLIFALTSGLLLVWAAQNVRGSLREMLRLR